MTVYNYFAGESRSLIEGFHPLYMQKRELSSILIVEVDMKKIIITILLCIAAFSLLAAYENPGFTGRYSLFVGMETPAFPPKDFGAMSTISDLHIPLGSYFSINQLALGIQWRQSKTFFRMSSIPRVEYFDLKFKYNLFPNKNTEYPAFTLVPYGGAAIILEPVTNNFGAAFNFGIIPSVHLFSFWDLQLPVDIKLFVDGFQISGLLSTHFVIIPIFIGLDIGFGYHLSGNYTFSQIGLSPIIQVQLGGEIR